MKTLIIGYGNLDRQDDGVAWHILDALMHRLAGQSLEFESEGIQPASAEVDLLGLLQLTPEVGETLTAYKLACFVDAHTGDVPEDLHVEPLDPRFQASPFTHHMTPQTCLSIAENLYQTKLSAWLVSVRGYQFGFSHQLSPGTAELAGQAALWIEHWVVNGDFITE